MSDHFLVLHLPEDASPDLFGPLLEMTTKTAHARATIRLLIQNSAVVQLTAKSTYLSRIEDVLALPAVRILACERSVRQAGVVPEHLVDGVEMVSSSDFLAETRWDRWVHVML